MMLCFQGFVSTLAGNGTMGYANGVGSYALFGSLFSLAVSSSLDIYASESINFAIRKITSSGMRIFELKL